MLGKVVLLQILWSGALKLLRRDERWLRVFGILPCCLGIRAFGLDVGRVGRLQS